MAVALRAEDEVIAFLGGDDGSVARYRSLGRVEAGYEGVGGVAQCMAVAGDCLFAGSTDACTYMWTITTRELLRVFHGHVESVTCLAVVGDPASGDGLLFTGAVTPTPTLNPLKRPHTPATNPNPGSTLASR